MTDKIVSFMETLAEHGLDPGSIQADGIVHRFSTWGDRSGESSGAYWYNGRVGWFQDWRTMEKPKVVKGKLSEADKAALAGSFNGAGQKVSRKKLEADIRRIWDAGTEPDGHPYLKLKRISAVTQIKQHDGQLIIPVFGINGELNGLQRIDADGRKRFLTGTRKKGSFFSIAGSKDHCIVCEGFATGVSIFHAMGCDIAVALDAGNIKPVTKAICKKIGSDKVIIAGDNDSWKIEKGQKDTGTATAKEAARMTGAAVALPTFKNPNGKQTTDFNDLANSEGLEEVKRQIEQALSDQEAQAEREAIKNEPKSNKRSSENLTQKIRDYISITVGIFTTRQVYDDFDIRHAKDKSYVRLVLHRLADQGAIERIKNQAGTWRKVDSQIEKMDVINVKVENVDLSLPLHIDNFVTFHPGNIILVGGDTNSGKTALLMNVAKDNIDNFAVHYFSSEMGPQEMRARIDLFDSFPIAHPNFNAYERTEDFADVIFPGRRNLNIIDYIELVEDFWKIAKYLKDIHEKLNGALAVVGVQKRNPESDDPLGGKRGLEKPRLVLAMRNGSIKIVKAKNWKTGNNPNGLQADFKLVDGCKFIRASDWTKDIK